MKKFLSILLILSFVFVSFISCTSVAEPQMTESVTDKITENNETNDLIDTIVTDSINESNIVTEGLLDSEITESFITDVATESLSEESNSQDVETETTDGMISDYITDITDTFTEDVVIETSQATTQTDIQTETLTQIDTDIQINTETVTQTDTDIAIQTETVTEAEIVTDIVTETVTESLTESVTETVTETVTESLTEDLTESVTDTVTESETQTDSVSITETAIETATETEKVTDMATDKVVESESETSAGSKECLHSNVENGKCKACEHQLYIREGDYIYFGEYPQSLKDDSVTIVATTPDSNGYYLGSDNCYYAKVVATPYATGYTFSNGAKVKSGTEYYFKVEPIKWKIVSQSSNEALILCESILINKAYDTSSNIYGESDVSVWLVNTFFSSAFDSIQQDFISTVTIDKSDKKVFLISENEAFSNAETRKLSTTDFARANGAWMTTSAGKGNGIWWLRTPNEQNSKQVKVVTNSGAASNYELVNNSGFGVVPALKIRIN